VAALASGHVAREAETVRAARQARIAEGNIKLVGVTVYPNADEQPVQVELVGRVVSEHHLGEASVDVIDRLAHALAEVTLRITVAQLQGFVLAGRRTGRDRRAAAGAEGGVALAYAGAATANGVAAFTTSSLPAGANIITASYPGDGTYQSSTSRTLYQTVQLNPTAMTLSSSLNPSTYGQPVTFTVAVAPQSDTGTTTGNVPLKNGTTPFASVALSNGAGTLTTSVLPAGALSINAFYNGDTNFATSSATLAQSVNVASTATAFTSTPNP